MNKEQTILLHAIRELANEKGIAEITLDKLKGNPDFNAAELDKYYPEEKALVRDILKVERKMFEVIFEDHNFDGYNDAIDILFTVIREMAGKFQKLSPSVTLQYKDIHPEVYQEHLEERVEFIFRKIQVNLKKGIYEGMYRDDVSIELVARRYISRLMDLHDPDNFPPEDFSINTMFSQMFESFVESIATEKGLAYFEEKKKKANLLKKN
ncbi:MAG: hypothetical protein L3J31_07610 [Bacteroidales bacterium]|nr:hypothetical protein [Bacteroidales bacterium]MCF6342652.1 hypothetical protein [Bacteroidales bacterium]